MLIFGHAEVTDALPAVTGAPAPVPGIVLSMIGLMTPVSSPMALVFGIVTLVSGTLLLVSRVLTPDPRIPAQIFGISASVPVYPVQEDKSRLLDTWHPGSCHHSPVSFPMP